VTAVLDRRSRSSAPLWRSPGLGALFTASTTARLANEAARVAMVLLVLARTGSPALAGAVVAALTLPALFTGPVLGAGWTARRTGAASSSPTRCSCWRPARACWPSPGTAPSYVVVLLVAAAGVTAPVLHRRLHRADPAAGAGAAPAAGVRRGGDELQPGRRRRAGARRALAAAASPDVAVRRDRASSALALRAVLRVPMPPPAGPGAGLVRLVGSG
jgi:hypothetical protein